MALLDTPWFVTVISVLNEGVNGHLLLLSEVAIVAWTLQCGRARMGLTREERIGLIRDLLHDTKMYSWNHALWRSDVAWVTQTALWMQKVLKSSYLLHCKGHALQTWESMLGSMNSALKQYVIRELLLKISIPCLLGFVVVLFFFSLSPFATSSEPACALLPFFQLLHTFYRALRDLGPQVLPWDVAICRTWAVNEHCMCSAAAWKQGSTCSAVPAAPS